MGKKRELFLFLSICLSRGLCAREVEAAGDIQIKVGNFSVPGTQQSGPLFGFGQALVDKGDALLILYTDYLKGCNKQNNLVFPYIIYGVTNRFGISIGLPIAARNRYNQFTSSGLSDLGGRLSYVVWNKSGEDFSNNISLMAGVTLPTGSFEKTPSIGLGAPSYFFGGSAWHLDPLWYVYTSYTLGITTRLHSGIVGQKDTLFGKYFLYQYGLGRNIFAKRGFIFNWLVELSGLYKMYDIIDGHRAPNSGSNTIFLAPSLLASSNHVTIQAGIGGFILQRYNGIQNSNRFIFAMSMSWRYNSFESTTKYD